MESRVLRGRVVLQTEGGLKTGRDIAMAAALGAEEFWTRFCLRLTRTGRWRRASNVERSPGHAHPADSGATAAVEGVGDHACEYMTAA